MALILTLEQQQQIKRISPNQKTGFYDQLASEVEENELRDLVGDPLKQDLQNNPDSANNAKLLNGDKYEDYHGNEIEHKGLRFVLAYYNYANYVNESFVEDTYTGMVRKTRTDSESIGEGTTRRLQVKARQIAEKEWALVKRYLEINSENYPLYYCCHERKKTNLPRFKGMRRTDR